MRCKEVIINVTLSGGTTSTASVFLFFGQLNLKFVIYDVIVLCWPEKSLVTPHFSSKQKQDYIFFSANANVLFQETPGLAHPQFVIDFQIFRPYCSRTLIFAGTYFGLIFRNSRYLIFANDKCFFISNVLVRSSPRIIQTKDICSIDNIISIFKNSLFSGSEQNAFCFRSLSNI